MSDIEDDLQPLHFLEQLAATGTETSAGIGSVGISARPIMGGTNCAQSLRVGALEVGHG